jgi:prepilin-type N-terminal cleavage/methylation domain-containing protein
MLCRRRCSSGRRVLSITDRNTCPLNRSPFAYRGMKGSNAQPQGRRLIGVREQGYSLVEMIVVIAIMGILAASAISAYKGMTRGTQLGVAQGKVDQLNGAVAKYSQISWEIDVEADDDSGDDELLVLRSLQWRDPVDPVHGTPFFETGWSPSASADDETFRIHWNGQGYDLIEPGDSGMGLRVRFDGVDMAQTINFGDSYRPVGPAG